MPRRLKVFRTTIGFHDAYVAAPSRKAALAAWGSDKDLFAMAAAEEVTDPEQMKEALERPGEVVKTPRGSFAEHLATSSRKPASAQKKKVRPPSRAALDKAEAALADFEHAAAQELANLAEREAALAHKRSVIEAQLAKARAKLKRRVDAETEKYARAAAQ